MNWTVCFGHIKFNNCSFPSLELYFGNQFVEFRATMVVDHSLQSIGFITTFCLGGHHVLPLHYLGCPIQWGAPSLVWLHSILNPVQLRDTSVRDIVVSLGTLLQWRTPCSVYVHFVLGHPVNFPYNNVVYFRGTLYATSERLVTKIRRMRCSYWSTTYLIPRSPRQFSTVCRSCRGWSPQRYCGIFVNPINNWI